MVEEKGTVTVNEIGVRMCERKIRRNRQPMWVESSKNFDFWNFCNLHAKSFLSFPGVPMIKYKCKLSAKKLIMNRNVKTRERKYDFPFPVMCTRAHAEKDEKRKQQEERKRNRHKTVKQWERERKRTL